MAALRTLPGLEQVAPGLAARGGAALDADWNGGWATLSAVPGAGTKAGGSRAAAGKDVGIRARLTAPRLQLEIPQGDGVESFKADLRDLRLTAEGNAANANISLKGTVQESKRSV